jgi:hypothetical protein
LTNLATLTASTQKYTYEGRGSSTLTSAGKTWAKPFDIKAPLWTLTLWDNFNDDGNFIYLVLYNGTLTATQNIKFGNFQTGTGTKTINMGSGTWELYGSGGSLWSVATSWLTFNRDTATIKITTNNADFTFNWNWLTFNNIWNASTGTSVMTMQGSNTFNDFKIDAGRSMKFTTGTTQTVNTFTATGSSGNLITINSTTTGTHALAKAGGGTISCDYLSVQHSVASPANTWYAGLNSTDNQSVSTAGSGWLFSLPVMLYTKTVAEVIAIASTLQNLSQKILAQSVTIASALRLGFVKDMFETIALSPTFIKYVSKPLSNALSVGSSFGSIGTFFRDMIEYLAVSEIFEKWVYKLQSFTETISIVSNTVKQGMKNMVDSLSVVDRLAKSISRVLVDSITLVSNYINARVKILTQSISVVDRVSKATSKVITNTISIASRLARSWGIILSKETITVAGSCVKSVFRAIINAISISALATIRITGFSIREAITISGSVRKSVSHKIWNAITISSRLARGFFFRASGVISIADSIKKSPMKLLREILAINRSFSMKLNGVLLDLWSRATKSVTDTWTRATKTITDPWKRTPKN